MRISEIFFSIQGESIYSGLPCVFVRVAGCNLKCSYCDTKHDVDNAEEFTPKEILDVVNTFTHTYLVEITGGEPLLYDDVYELIELLHHAGFKVLIETNGSLDLKKIPDYVCKIVDVKTAGSGHGDSFLVSNLSYINPVKDNLKFVLCDMNDYEWMKEFLKKHDLYGSHVLVSTVFTWKEGMNMVCTQVLEDGLDVRFQLQMHKYIGLR